MKAALSFGNIGKDIIIENYFILAPSDLDFINVHATSTPAGDLCEAKAIFNLLGDSETRKKVVVTANKSSIGHTFGAAGGVESVFAIKSLEEVSII